MDLHSAQIQGFFDIPFDHLYASPVLTRHFREMGLENLVVAAPDVGAVKMARAYAKRLGAALVVANKRRGAADSSEVMEIIGEVEGRTVLLIDDLISTAGTIRNASRALKARGARQVLAGCTHPCFSGPAVENLEAAGLQQLVVTDTIPVANHPLGDRLKVLSAGDLFGEAVVRIHEERSLSGLFD